MEIKSKNEFKVNIIRYERFNNCFEKIKFYRKNNPIDYLIFSIRSEQYLRLSKLYYKYQDRQKKVKRSLIIPFLNMIAPEKYDLLMMDLPVPNSKAAHQSYFHNFLVRLNYISGMIIGNNRFAINIYSQLIENIIKFCNNENIKLLILGPASRPHLQHEDNLISEMNYYFKNLVLKRNVPYVELIGKYDENGNDIFFPNKIHVNEIGHERASKLIMNEMVRNSYI